MQTLPHRPQPTIIDCLEGGLVNMCPDCRKPVAVRRLPRFGEFDEWSDHIQILYTRCHTCVLRAAPEIYRGALEARFDHLLDVRKGLGSLPAWERDPAGIPRPMPATLNQRTWYPVNRDGPEEPYLEEFSIIGRLPVGFDATAARDALARSPVYRILRVEEGPQLDVQWVAVHLTVRAYLPAVPNAYLEWRWDPDIPEWSWEPMIRGFSRASATDLKSLMYHGKRLFAIDRSSRGRYPDHPDVLCVVFEESLPSAIKRARDGLEKEGEFRSRTLRQHELADQLGMSVDTLQGRMERCKIDWLELRDRQG